MRLPVYYHTLTITYISLQIKVLEHHVIRDQDYNSKFGRTNDCLTHEDLARYFWLLLLLLVGLPSIFLYMACSAPLCSECFFTSFDSSAWIVCTEETRQTGAAGSRSTTTHLLHQTSYPCYCITTQDWFPYEMNVSGWQYPYIHKWSAKHEKITSWSFSKEIGPTIFLRPW